MDIFETYLLVYTLLAFTYIWYRYIFILAYSNKIKGNYFAKASIIIPFYNENPSLLKRTVKSAHSCRGKNEIIVIDDGSKSKEGYNELLKLKKEIPFKLIRYEENKGKRYAQIRGFKEAKGEIIMTLDSDTLLHRNAVINLIKPFSDKKIGATTGQLEILNENKNLLTKMQAARYWNAFNLERKSQGTLGVVVCCSGPISAYRKKVLDKIIPEYENQCFLGEECTYGDDRNLTTLTLKNGYDVYYVKNAIGYTDVPEKLSKFIKQQIRWKKSWIRENYLVSKFMLKRSKALSFEIFITTFITFFSIIARVSLIIISLIMRPFYLFWVIPMIFFMASIHSLYIMFHKPRYFIYSIAYGFLHALVIYWLVFIAAATLKKTGWGTR